MSLKLEETDEYEKLVKFFVENELEFDGDEEVDTDILHCYQITDDKSGFLAGAAVLAKREGKFIIDGIAVDKSYRNMRTGKILLDKVIDTIKKDYGGRELYLVARAPGFFRKNGFEAVNPETAPNFFECRTCPQYKVNCFPEIMKKVID